MIPRRLPLRLGLALLPPVLLLALPWALRPSHQQAAAGPEAGRLIILSPHNEHTRSEFEDAFRAWLRRETGQEVEFDWRSPGGTNVIMTMLDDQFAVAVARDLGPRHPDVRGVAAAFDPGNDTAKAEPGPRALRRDFLASEVGVGFDLVWGGGEYEFRKRAGMGLLVDSGLVAAMPETFCAAVIPQRLGGETVYDPQGRYLGTCFATFGICHNPTRITTLGLAPPRAWADLGDPRLLGEVVMADPTRSGSINACFERLIQERMAKACVEGETPERLAAGWGQAWDLLKRIGGNANQVTDAASKVVRDVERGEAAAGMCIDHYGRLQAGWSERQTGGAPRIATVLPLGGTSVSADPIGLLRGAPNREMAVRFLRFVMSVEGQRLWNRWPGGEGGPRRQALRRLPVRRDLYTDSERAAMTDPEADPYALAAAFTYRPQWTGRLFTLIRVTMKAVILDPRDDLVAAWRAIVAAGGPEAVPEAMRELAWMPYAWSATAEAAAAIDASKHPALDIARTLRGWTEQAQVHYRRAKALAEEGR